MANNGVSFVEWKEEFVSQERGSRIVHYILKDSCGKSVLAVVGTERSLRHMVYVVADEFLSYSSSDNSVQAGFKWRSRREVVDWLTSMLAKQQSDSPRGDTTDSLGSPELSAQRISFADKMDHRVRNSRQSFSDILWLGAPWTCGKQLKHYPAFCRNGTTISAQSFVFVMAKEENRYVAYLEDMYEDRKGQKKVKVRWFHHSREVKGVVRLRNAHPKEVYITPYTQVISVECVDGPAIVLTREHFEKCEGSFPQSLLGKVHFCSRQFRSNKIKPFELSKMKGYFQQPIISCVESNTFPNSDSIFPNLVGETLGKTLKRKRNSGDQESFLTAQADFKGNGWKRTMFAPLCRMGNSDVYNKRFLFKVDDKIELLCQDSGIRGCWFRCTVLETSRKQMKVQYSDLEDQDGCGKLEEWVPAFRLAATDRLGMRCLGRPTIRPCPPISDSEDTDFQVGSPVDAWWSDGWWEGVVTATSDSVDDFQVYIPGENKFLTIPKKDLRVSRDWIGGKWMDVKAKLDILTVIGTETKSPMTSTLEKDDKDDDHLAPQTKVDENENKDTDLPVPDSSDDHMEQDNSPEKKVEDNNDQKKDQDGDDQEKDQNGDDQRKDQDGDEQRKDRNSDDQKRDQDSSDYVDEKSDKGDNINIQVDDQNMGNDNDDGSLREGKSSELALQNSETSAKDDEAVEQKEV